MVLCCVVGLGQRLCGLFIVRWFFCFAGRLFWLVLLTCFAGFCVSSVKSRVCVCFVGFFSFAVMWRLFSWCFSATMSSSFLVWLLAYCFCVFARTVRLFLTFLVSSCLHTLLFRFAYLVGVCERCVLSCFLFSFCVCLFFRF